MGGNITSSVGVRVELAHPLSEKENGKVESKTLNFMDSVHSSNPDYTQMKSMGKNNFTGEDTREIHILKEGITGNTAGKNEIDAAHPGSLSPLFNTDYAKKLFNRLTMSGINLNGLNIKEASEEKKNIISLMGILANFSKSSGKSLAAEERRQITENDNSTVSQFACVGKELKTRLVTTGKDALSHFIICFNNECDKKWLEIHPGLAHSHPESQQYNINRQFCNKLAKSHIEPLTASNATEVEILTQFRLFRDVFLAQASTLDSGCPVERYFPEGATGLTSEIACGGAGDHSYQTERDDNSAHSSCQIQTVADIHAPPVKAEVNGISYNEIDRVNKSNAEPPAPGDEESDELQMLNNQKALKTYIINQREAKLVTDTVFDGLGSDEESDELQMLNNQKALKTYIINQREAKLVTDMVFDGLGFLDNKIKSTELSKIRPFWRPRPTQG